MIILYHQTKTPISFWCRWELNPRSLIQPSETLPVKLTGTHIYHITLFVPIKIYTIYHLYKLNCMYITILDFIYSMDVINLKMPNVSLCFLIVSCTSFLVE